MVFIFWILSIISQHAGALAPHSEGQRVLKFSAVSGSEEKESHPKSKTKRYLGKKLGKGKNLEKQVEKEAKKFMEWGGYSLSSWVEDEREEGLLRKMIDVHFRSRPKKDIQDQVYEKVLSLYRIQKYAKSFIYENYEKLRQEMFSETVLKETVRVFLSEQVKECDQEQEFLDLVRDVFEAIPRLFQILEEEIKGGLDGVLGEGSCSWEDDNDDSLLEATVRIHVAKNGYDDKRGKFIAKKVYREVLRCYKAKKYIDDFIDTYYTKLRQEMPSDDVLSGMVNTYLLKENENSGDKEDFNCLNADVLGGIRIRFKILQELISDEFEGFLKRGGGVVSSWIDDGESQLKDEVRMFVANGGYESQLEKLVTKGVYREVLKVALIQKQTDIFIRKHYGNLSWLVRDLASLREQVMDDFEKIDTENGKLFHMLASIDMKPHVLKMEVSGTIKKVWNMTQDMLKSHEKELETALRDFLSTGEDKDIESIFEHLKEEVETEAYNGQYLYRLGIVALLSCTHDQYFSTAEAYGQFEKNPKDHQLGESLLRCFQEHVFFPISFFQDFYQIYRKGTYSQITKDLLFFCEGQLVDKLRLSIDMGSKRLSEAQCAHLFSKPLDYKGAVLDSMLRSFKRAFIREYGDQLEEGVKLHLTFLDHQQLENFLNEMYRGYMDVRESLFLEKDEERLEFLEEEYRDWIEKRVAKSFTDMFGEREYRTDQKGRWVVKKEFLEKDFWKESFKQEKVFAKFFLIEHSFDLDAALFEREAVGEELKRLEKEIQSYGFPHVPLEEISDIEGDYESGRGEEKEFQAFDDDFENFIWCLYMREKMIEYRNQLEDDKVREKREEYIAHLEYYKNNHMRMDSSVEDEKTAMKAGRPFGSSCEQKETERVRAGKAWHKWDKKRKVSCRYAFQDAFSSKWSTFFRQRYGIQDLRQPQRSYYRYLEGEINRGRNLLQLQWLVSDYPRRVVWDRVKMSETCFAVVRLFWENLYERSVGVYLQNIDRKDRRKLQTLQAQIEEVKSVVNPHAGVENEGQKRLKELKRELREKEVTLGEKNRKNKGILRVLLNKLEEGEERLLFSDDYVQELERERDILMAKWREKLIEIEEEVKREEGEEASKRIAQVVPLDQSQNMVFDSMDEKIEKFLHDFQIIQEMEMEVSVYKRGVWEEDGGSFQSQDDRPDHEEGEDIEAIEAMMSDTEFDLLYDQCRCEQTWDIEIELIVALEKWEDKMNEIGGYPRERRVFFEDNDTFLMMKYKSGEGRTFVDVYGIPLFMKHFVAVCQDTDVRERARSEYQECVRLFLQLRKELKKIEKVMGLNFEEKKKKLIEGLEEFKSALVEEEEKRVREEIEQEIAEEIKGQGEEKEVSYFLDMYHQHDCHGEKCRRAFEAFMEWDGEENHMGWSSVFIAFREALVDEMVNDELEVPFLKGVEQLEYLWNWYKSRFYNKEATLDTTFIKLMENIEDVQDYFEAYHQGLSAELTELKEKFSGWKKEDKVWLYLERKRIEKRSNGDKEDSKGQQEDSIEEEDNVSVDSEDSNEHQEDIIEEEEDFEERASVKICQVRGIKQRVWRIDVRISELLESINKFMEFLKVKYKGVKVVGKTIPIRMVYKGEEVDRIDALPKDVEVFKLYLLSYYPELKAKMAREQEENEESEDENRGEESEEGEERVDEHRGEESEEGEERVDENRGAKNEEGEDILKMISQRRGQWKTVLGDNERGGKVAVDEGDVEEETDGVEETDGADYVEGDVEETGGADYVEGGVEETGGVDCVEGGVEETGGVDCVEGGLPYRIQVNGRDQKDDKNLRKKMRHTLGVTAFKLKRGLRADGRRRVNLRHTVGTLIPQPIPQPMRSSSDGADDSNTERVKSGKGRTKLGSVLLSLTPKLNRKWQGAKATLSA